VGASVAALLEPSDRTRFGFSWRSESEPEMKGKPKLRNLSPLLESIGRRGCVSGSTSDNG
jgi:hypothetical protein